MSFLNYKNMKKGLTIIFALMMTVVSMAQERRVSATMYGEFKPSVITFTDGHKSSQPLTNVFLKNSSLLYFKGDNVMEATMDNILAVDFDDRHFVTIDKKLAYRVAQVKENELYCVELFDQETYERNIRNNINFSNIDFLNMNPSSFQNASVDIVGSTTTVDMNNEEDFKLPVFRHFYMRLNDNWVKVHERDLGRVLPKEKKTMMKRIMAQPNFSWQREESLKQLLEAISD